MTEAELLAEIEKTLRAQASSVKTLRATLARSEERYWTSSDTSMRKLNLRRQLQEMDKLLAEVGGVEQPL